MYNKLFGKILDSSIWLEDTPTRIVWVTFLAAMDQDGFAPFSAIGNLANRARVTTEEAEKAVKILSEPDPNSGNPENEGRRIEAVPGGFMVLNSSIYRDIVKSVNQREQTRARVAKHREKKKKDESVTDGNDLVTTSNTISKAVAGKYSEEFENDWKNYPKRAGGNPKGPADKQRTARLNEGYTANEISSGIERYFNFCRATGKIGTEYVMQTKRFLGRDKHFLEPWDLPVQNQQPGGEGKLTRAVKALEDARNEHTTGNGGAGNAGYVGQTTPQLPKS